MNNADHTVEMLEIQQCIARRNCNRAYARFARTGNEADLAQARKWGETMNRVFYILEEAKNATTH